MSRPAEIAEVLRREAMARSTSPATERRAALLAVLRQELDGLSWEEVCAVLVRLRELVSPGDAQSEAANLWEVLGLLGPSASEPPRQTAATSHDTGGLDGLARSIFGADWLVDSAPTAEQRARLVRVLELAFGALEAFDTAFRGLTLELRRARMLGNRRGGTVFDLKMQAALRKVAAKAILETGDLGDLEKRLKIIASSIVLMNEAHEASTRKAIESIRQHLDPATLQKEHGGEAWKAFRRVYHNELYDFGDAFREQFVATPFLEEFFRILDQVK